jgi:hypothetical protein
MAVVFDDAVYDFCSLTLKPPRTKYTEKLYRSVEALASIFKKYDPEPAGEPAAKRSMPEQEKPWDVINKHRKRIDVEFCARRAAGTISVYPPDPGDVQCKDIVQLNDDIKANQFNYALRFAPRDREKIRILAARRANPETLACVERRGDVSLCELNPACSAKENWFDCKPNALNCSKSDCKSCENVNNLLILDIALRMLFRQESTSSAFLGASTSVVYQEKYDPLFISDSYRQHLTRRIQAMDSEEKCAIYKAYIEQYETKVIQKVAEWGFNALKGFIKMTLAPEDTITPNDFNEAMSKGLFTKDLSELDTEKLCIFLNLVIVAASFSVPWWTYLTFFPSGRKMLTEYVTAKTPSGYLFVTSLGILTKNKQTNLPILISSVFPTDSYVNIEHNLTDIGFFDKVRLSGMAVKVASLVMQKIAIYLNKTKSK